MNPAGTSTTNPVVSTPAARSFIQNQTMMPKVANSSPAYSSTGVPNFSTSSPSGPSVPQMSPTPTTSTFPTIKGDPTKVFGTVNGRDYNYAGDWLGGNNAGNSGSTVLNSGSTGVQTNTNGTDIPTGNAPSSTISPDRQAYIDAYKKYLDAQTNNADVAESKKYLNQLILDDKMARERARNSGETMGFAGGEEARVMRNNSFAIDNATNAYNAAVGARENNINANKSGVDFQKSLLDFGTADRTETRANKAEDRLNNPDFSLGEGQVHYTYDSKTGIYKKTSGPAKTYKPTSTNSVPSANAVNQHIRQQMATPEFQKATPEQQKLFILQNGGNPVDYNIF